MKRSILLALAAAATLSLAFTAPASADSFQRGERVSYADLNLSTQDGARTLLARIHRAADRVCFVANGPQPLDLHIARRECVNDAVGRAVARLDIPTVTAMYQGGSAPTVIASR